MRKKKQENDGVKMKLLLCLMLMINSAHGAFPLIDVENINGTYVDGKGVAYAEKAAYTVPHVKISHERIDLKFNNKAKSLVIADIKTKVELDFDFSFLNVLKSFEFTNVDVKSSTQLFTVLSDEMTIFISGKNYKLNELFFETDVRNIPTQDDDDISILDGFLLHADLSIKKFKFVQSTEEFFNDMKIENPSRVSELNNLVLKSKLQNIPMIIRHFRLKVREGIFFGKAKIDTYLNFWFNIAGKIKANKEQTELDIHVTKAKLGYFSVISTIMSAIKALGMDGVSVKGNHIFIDFENVSKNAQNQNDDKYTDTI